MIFAVIAAFLLVFWVVGFLLPTADAQLQLGVIAWLCAANLAAVIMMYYKKRKLNVRQHCIRRYKADC